MQGYSIGEVSDIVGVKDYILRYWESEFEELSPQKNEKGRRVYTQHDIDIILTIKDLLYNQKFTINGAKKEIKKILNPTNKTTTTNQGNTSNTSVLEKVKKELYDVLKTINEAQEQNHN